MGVSLDYQLAQRQRELLAKSQVLQQEEISMFIVSCVQLADDLRKLCQMRRQYPGVTTNDIESAASYIQSKITDEFKRRFGHSMIQEAPCSNS